MDQLPKRRGRKSRLTPFAAMIGVRSDEDVAKAAGCTVANVYMYRRRHGIAAPSVPAPPPAPTVSRGSLLDAWVHVLGTLPDVEVAKMAGCTTANVSLYRRRRGIPSSIAHRVITRAAAVTPAPAAPAPAQVAASNPSSSAPAARSAWQVRVSGRTGVVVAADFDGARAASPAGAEISWLGELL